MRRVAGEAAVRFLLFCAAAGLLRWASATWRSWQEDFSSSFEYSWAPWVGWVALLVAAGFVAGLASLTARPSGYRLHVPLAITLPALLLLAHWPLLVESAEPGGGRLPWILDNFYFYMDTPAQFALAVIAGFGLAAGFRPRGPADSG